MPINTLQNWLNEFNTWLPEDADNSPLRNHGEVRPRNFRIHILNDSHKTLKSRSKVVLEWARNGGVLLIGYEMYRLLSQKKMTKKKKKKKGVAVELEEEKESTEEQRNMFDDIHEALVKPGPDLVVCDEGHRIKNSHASISVALKQIKSKRRVVLTGYPLQNNLLEYWCMVDFVRPNYLGTKTEFSNMFERPIQNGQCIDSTPQDIKLMRYRAHVLHSLLLGFVQRRSHSVLQTSLPQKEEYVLLIRMTEFQRKLYSVFMNEVVRTKAVPNPLKAFAVCCKIWNHPDVLYNFLKQSERDLDLELEEPEPPPVPGGVPGAVKPGEIPSTGITPATSGTVTPMEVDSSDASGMGGPPGGSTIPGNNPPSTAVPAGGGPGTSSSSGKRKIEILDNILIKKSKNTPSEGGMVAGGMHANSSHSNPYGQPVDPSLGAGGIAAMGAGDSSKSSFQISNLLDDKNAKQQLPAAGGPYGASDGAGGVVGQHHLHTAGHHEREKKGNESSHYHHGSAPSGGSSGRKSSKSSKAGDSSKHDRSGASTSASGSEATAADQHQQPQTSATQHMDFDISEKLKEMGEISVKPVSKTDANTKSRASELECNEEISLEITKKDAAMRKVSNLRKNIKEVMDDNQLDASTLAAQRQELERLARVQEQQRIIREVQRQLALERQTNKTEQKVMQFLQGHASILKSQQPSTSSTAASGSGSGGVASTTPIRVGYVKNPFETRGRPPKNRQLLISTATTSLLTTTTTTVAASTTAATSTTNLTPSVSIAPVKASSVASAVTPVGPPSTTISASASPSPSLIPVRTFEEMVDSEEELEPEEEPEDEDEDSDGEVIALPEKKEIVTIDSSSDDDCIVLSDDDEEPEDESDDDPQNSGLHVNDAYNVPDEQGRVVINVGHADGEEDIFLAPQIARIIKPHQIGGVRFLFDNIIESIERYDSSTGFGCILAHSMGLGKTLQLV